LTGNRIAGDDAAVQHTLPQIQPSPLDYPYTQAPEARHALCVAPGVLWLRLPLPFALDHINVWLLRDGAGWTLVDTGIGNDATRAQWEVLMPELLEGRPILRVIATHAHPDHLGLADWFTTRHHCPLWMTQGEYLTAHSIWNEVAGYGAAPLGRMFKRHGLDPARVDAIVSRGNLYRRGVPAIPTSYRRILDGEQIVIGPHRWRVIAGYGHSAEHAALYCEDLSLLISGDMLLPKISTNVSVWPTDPDGDPVGLFLDSIRRFDALPADTLVLPSHGLPFRGIQARTGALHAHHEARLGELLAAAATPMTAADALPILFRRELDNQQLFFAMGEAIAHLNHLYYRVVLKRALRDDNVIAFTRTA
jgi:glyoxylase-like metal-dependent hydrolase (beta-lactamase superfamily II)